LLPSARPGRADAECLCARPRLRWEWTPEQVSIHELYPYYDYVLTRGRSFSPPPGTFHPIWTDDRWSLFERDGR
jgi:hypothetical protein